MSAKKNAPHKKHSFLFLLLIFIVWSCVLFYFGPEKITGLLGDQNSYIVLAIMALIGGTSILFPFPYYLFTISFAAAGLNPVLLALSASIGTLIGDSTTYYLAYKGKGLLPTKHAQILENLFESLLKKHPSLFPLVAFLYSSITPLPDDILMIPAGLTHYPFKKLALAIGPGKFVFNLIVAVTGLYGFQLLL